MPASATTENNQPRARRATPAPPPVHADLTPLIVGTEHVENRLAAVESTLATLVTKLDSTVTALAQVVENVASAQPARKARGRAQTTGKTETLKQGIVAVMKGKRRSPMNAKAIMAALEERGGHVPGGETPEATVAAMLATEHAKGGLFERTAPGQYRLRSTR